MRIELFLVAGMQPCNLYTTHALERVSQNRTASCILEWTPCNLYTILAYRQMIIHLLFRVFLFLWFFLTYTFKLNICLFLNMEWLNSFFSNLASIVWCISTYIIAIVLLIIWCNRFSCSVILGQVSTFYHILLSPLTTANQDSIKRLCFRLAFRWLFCFVWFNSIQINLLCILFNLNTDINLRSWQFVWYVVRFSW